MCPKKLKILHLISQRPDSTGSGFYIQAMLREAKAKNHDNYLIAGIQPDWTPVLDSISKDKCSFVRFSGVDISYQIVGMSDVMPYQSTRFCDLNEEDILEYENCFTKKLKNVVRQFKPDIIHSHHLWILTSLARRTFPEIPIVTSSHGSDLRQFRKCLDLQKKVLSGCSRLDAIIALHEAHKKEIAELYNFPSDRIYVIGAGYNNLLFSQNNKPEPDPVQLTYAGKLSRAKGVPWLLSALSRIDSPSWQLHLVGGGSGEEKEECLNLARILGERVRVHGAISQPELAKIVKQSHIFILPSFFEGLPLVLLEALASGCRLIATDLPGIIEVLGNMNTDYIHLVKTPRLFSIDSPFPEDEKIFEKNLANALKVQMDAATKQSQIDLSPIEEKIASFSWPGVFERVERIYFEVIKNFQRIETMQQIKKN